MNGATNPSPQVQAYLPRYPAAEIYQAASPVQRPTAPAVALPVSSTALVNGGPDSVLQLVGQGVLGEQEPAVIAGDLTSAPPALWAVTDGQRRVDHAFGLINANTSFTYTATETNPPGNGLGAANGPPRQILPVPAAGHQTVAVLSGAASVTASSYGSWLTYQPQYDPVNAFDGNSATAWAEGNPHTPVGQWIQITFDHRIDLPDPIGVQLLDDRFSRSIANELEVSTTAGRVTTPVVPTNATQQLRVRPGPTSWLRITITGASNIVAGNPGAGISQVLIPGVRVTRYLRPPEQAVRSAASVAFSFHQAAPGPAGEAAIATTVPIARVFTLPVPLQMQLTGTAVAQPSTGLQDLLGKLAPTRRSSLLVSASSTWGSLPEFGPDNLFSRTTTPWIAGSSDPVIDLSWQGMRRISKIVVQPAYGFATAPAKIKVASFFGTREATIGLGGVATIWPPLRTDEMELSFPGWSSAAQPGTGPGQPTLGLARLTIPALSRLHVTPLNSQTPFSLACGRGPAVMLDGQSYPTSVSGTLGQLAGNLPVQVRLCAPGSAVSLGSGQHQLLASPGLFTMTDVALQSPPADSTAAAAPTRSLNVLSWQPESRTLRIGPGQASYVELHQNANAGWVASLDGRPLATARLDGWQQAVVVPAGVGGIITMKFVPGTPYHIGLALSVLAIVGLLAVAFGWRRWVAYVFPLAYFIEVGWSVQLKAGRGAALWVPLELLAVLAAAVIALAIARFRRDLIPSTGKAVALRGTQAVASLTADSSARIRHRAAGRPAAIRPWIGPLAVGVLIFVIGGPVVLAVPLVVVIAALRPWWLPVTALAAMLIAGIIAAAAAAPATTSSGTFGPAAQACALIAMAAVLMPAVFAPAPDRDGWRPSRPLPAPGIRVPSRPLPAPGSSAALPALQPTRPADESRPRAEPTERRLAGDTVLGPPHPLPRAPFSIADELSCYYDTPAEPCNVHLEVRVPGHLESAALRRAINAALAEQPRALARRAPGGRWQRSYAWEVPGHPDLDPLNATTWADEHELAQQRMQFLAASPPLDSSPPVRLLLAAGPGEARLILNAHHAALDGISCLELLRGIARQYQGAVSSVPPAAAVPARGDDPPAPPAALARPVPGEPGRPSRGWPPGMLPRSAARIAAEVTSAAIRAPARSDLPGYGFRLITREGVPRVPRTGQDPHVTVNDLLISALIVAIGRWNSAHGRATERIRITMPVNSRAPSQAGAAGNLSRLTAVSARPPDQDGDAWPLVADVAAQTLSARSRPGPQVGPLSWALAAAWCPTAVKRRLLRLALRTAGPLICDTSLVSNLGIVADPPRFGPAPATHMWFSTSAHMPRGLSVGAITLGGNLHLCLRYRHALFSEPAAARFTEIYAAALNDVTGRGGDSDRQY